MRLSVSVLCIFSFVLLIFYLAPNYGLSSTLYKYLYTDYTLPQTKQQQKIHWSFAPMDFDL